MKTVRGVLLIEALPALRAYCNLLLNERSKFDENRLSKLVKVVEDAVVHIKMRQAILLFI
jgi:hypothetical protein